MISRKWLLCMAALVAVLLCAPAQADRVQLTLDLTNNDPLDPLSGGSWQLSARMVETGSGAQGDFGISGIRTMISDIDLSSVTFAPDINSITCGGGPCAAVLSNGAIEVVYGQDISSPSVVTGVGVSSNPNLDHLIASGVWPTGPRPLFTSDEGGAASESNFLGGASAPFPAAVEADATLTAVVTLGDLNGTNTVTAADVALFQSQFFPPTGPYNAAADINQSGTISGADYQLLLDIAGVPEPATLMLVGMALIGLALPRR